MLKRKISDILRIEATIRESSCRMGYGVYLGVTDVYDYLRGGKVGWRGVDMMGVWLYAELLWNSKDFPGNIRCSLAAFVDNHESDCIFDVFLLNASASLQPLDFSSLLTLSLIHH